MKKTLITNFNEFKRFSWKSVTNPPNYKVIWYGHENTWYFQRKNKQKEGVQIIWKGNPLDLKQHYFYFSEK